MTGIIKPGHSNDQGGACERAHTLTRFGEPVRATPGGNLKQNGIALGKTGFPKTGRRLSSGQTMAKTTGPT